MEIPSFDLNRSPGKKASGPFEVLLNGEPFDVERSLVETNGTGKSVSFFSPIVELYQRAVTIQIPLKALPGTYPINPENPNNFAALIENRYILNPGPDDPPGYGFIHLALRGSIELIEWDPAAMHMIGRFNFTIFIDNPDQLLLFEGKFDLRELT